MSEPVENTDKEIWREIADDYYAPSIFVTEQNSIGINVGGYVYIKTVEEWHKQANRIEELEKIIREGIQAFGAIQEQQLKDKFENTIWCDCGDGITNNSGAKCGVCARETK